MTRAVLACAGCAGSLPGAVLRDAGGPRPRCALCRRHPAVLLAVASEAAIRQARVRTRPRATRPDVRPSRPARTRRAGKPGGRRSRLG